MNLPTINSPRLEGGFRQVQKTDPKEMARAMLADKAERDGKTTMTWNRDNAPLVPNDRMVGEVNLNLPYHKVMNSYLIQNGNIYKINGRDRLSLSDVKRIDPGTFPVLLEAYEAFMKKAVQKDPRLCKDCIAQSKILSLPNDTDEILEHMVQEHPEKVLQASRSQAAPEPEPEPVPSNTESFVARCGKPLNSTHGKRLHELRCKACKS